MRLALALACLVVACSSPAPRVQQPTPRVQQQTSPPPPSAVDILDRTVETYAKARSYSDRGTSITSSSVTHHETKTFTTAFVRPGQLRFEYRDEGKAERSHVIWLADGVARRTWFVRPNEVQEFGDVNMPLGAAAGVSTSLSLLIPSLLLDSNGGFIRRLEQAAHAGETTIDGRRCWQIAAQIADEKLTLVIDRQSYLIRRIDRVYQVESTGRAPLDVAQTIDYEPRIDIDIPVVELAGPDIRTLTVASHEAPRWIGVLFVDQTNEIRDVLPNSPAARAGLRRGDKLVSLGGTPIATVLDVIRLVAGQKAGAKLDAEYERDGARKTTGVVVAFRPNLAKVQADKLHGKPAPEIDLATADGKRFKLSDHKGKVVLIDFWATWCKPCAAALPDLLRWNAKLGPRGLVVVGVTDEDLADVRPYVAENNIPYPIPHDPQRDAWRDYLVEGLPTTVIIDKAGVVRYVEAGYGGVREIERLLEKLLK